jgi:hypothetical protein
VEFTIPFPFYKSKIIRRTLLRVIFIISLKEGKKMFFLLCVPPPPAAAAGT